MQQSKPKAAKKSKGEVREKKLTAMKQQWLNALDAPTERFIIPAANVFSNRCFAGKGCLPSLRPCFSDTDSSRVLCKVP